MRTFIILFLLVSALHAAPRSDYELAIVRKMNERYDFQALTQFLKRIVQEHPSFEKVPLASTKIEAQWHFEKVDPPSRMRNGEWVMWDQNGGDESFDLYYNFDASHSVTIRAKRLAKDRFACVGLSIEQWESLR
jgi:hypothetical protein